MMKKRGMTLIEVVIVVVLFAVLTIVTVYVFRAILLAWSSNETRVGVDIVVDRGIEEMVRDIREAQEIQSTADRDEVRLTQNGADYYIYYLYHEDDTYGPPPVFDEDYYELKKADLTGDINGTFTYGDGKIIVSDVVPPGSGSNPKTDISMDANSLVTIILKMEREAETITSKTQVRPRNL